jgi:hypothetical protein
MRAITQVAIAFSFGALLMSRMAHADSQDTPAILGCQRDVLQLGGATPTFANAVGNSSTTAILHVVCPVFLYAATGRTLVLFGQDQNTSMDISCRANGWDVNLNSVNMPSIPVHTGTFFLEGFASISIPDSVAKLTISCSIPTDTQNGSSTLNDFIVQN